MKHCLQTKRLERTVRRERCSRLLGSAARWTKCPPAYAAPRLAAGRPFVSTSTISRCRRFRSRTTSPPGQIRRAAPGFGSTRAWSHATDIEAVAREKFDTLEGWGTFAPLTVAFDKAKVDDPAPAIDLENIASRHQGDDFDFADDAVYLVNLATGLPVPIDIGEGLVSVRRSARKAATSETTRAHSSRTCSGRPPTKPSTRRRARSIKAQRYAKSYRPAWDTDFDGVLDRPNLVGPARVPQPGRAAGQAGRSELERRSKRARRGRTRPSASRTAF